MGLKALDPFILLFLYILSNLPVLNIRTMALDNPGIRPDAGIVAPHRTTRAYGRRPRLSNPGSPGLDK